MGMIDATKMEVANLMEKADNAHGMTHITNVLNMSIMFGMELKLNEKDLDDVRLIALLHDADDYKLFNKQEGDDLPNAKKILNVVTKDYAFPEERKEKILTAICQIGYSKWLQGIRPTTIEAMIVSDADMCDGMGMNGVVRTIQYHDHKNWPIISDRFPRGEINYESYTSKDDDVLRDTVVNHMFEKLLLLKGMMMTAPGYREAAERHESMVCFLRSYFKENRLHQWSDYLEEFLRTRC